MISVLGENFTRAPIQQPTSEIEVTSVFFLSSAKSVFPIVNPVTDMSLEKGGSSPVCSSFHKTAMISEHERERHAQGKNHHSYCSLIMHLYYKAMF